MASEVDQELVVRLNNLSDSTLSSELYRCCGSREWVENMKKSMPFSSFEHMIQKANTHWWSLDDEGMKEAFLQHPMIGDLEHLKKKYAHANEGFEGEEQSGTSSASEEELLALQQGNKNYFEKFGHIFLICATGKSAGEMLSALQSRIHNEPPMELIVAAQEHEKITQLRLAKLLQSLSSSSL